MSAKIITDPVGELMGLLRRGEVATSKPIHNMPHHSVVERRWRAQAETLVETTTYADRETGELTQFRTEHPFDESTVRDRLFRGFPIKVIAPWAGKRIHNAEAIEVFSFDPGFVDAAAAVLERRNTVTLTVTEQQLYLDLNGTNLSSAIHVRGID